MNGSPLFGPDGFALLSVEERCFRDLVHLMQLLARELARDGIDPNVVLSEPPVRGFRAPVIMLLHESAQPYTG